MAIVKCKECGHDVSNSAKTCPHCGYKIQRSNLPILFLILFVLAVAINYGNTGNESSKSSVAQAGESNQDRKESPEKIESSCLNFSKKFGYESKLTSAQKTEIWEKNYQGKIFNWQVQLVSVEKNLDGSYFAAFVCLPPTNKPLLINLEIPTEFKEKVLKIKKGATYILEGRLLEFEVAPLEFSDQVSAKVQSTFVEIQPSNSFKKTATNVEANWIMRGSDKTCFPAKGEFDYNKIKADYRECKPDNSGGYPDGVYILDCRLSVLGTQLAFFKTLDLCNRMSKSVEPPSI